MTLSTLVRAAAALAAMTLLPGALAAQTNTTSANAAELPAGTDRTFTFVEGSLETRWYTFSVRAGRSYCVEATPGPAENNAADSTDPKIDVFAADLITALGDNNNAGTEPDLGKGARVCFVPTATGDVFVRVRMQANSIPATETRTFLIRAVETALYSPYWQVFTAAAYDAAPQIRNNTDQPVTVYFRAFDASGLAVACPTAGFVLPGNGMMTFGISSMCGISSGFGSAEVSHTGAPGAVTANITTFSGASGLSFDAAFTAKQDFR